MSSIDQHRNYHGPDNAEHEIRKAYVATMMSFLIEPRTHEVETYYRRAFNAHRKEDRLAAERWARTTKHLSRALSHEAMICLLERSNHELPQLTGLQPDECNLAESVETTVDLINSVAEHIPPGLNEMPPDMRSYLLRARIQLANLRSENPEDELLRAERIMAAHEYGRVLECMALAYEAETTGHKGAA